MTTGRSSRVLTSGFSEAKLSSNVGALVASLQLLSKPYRKEGLARTLRDALDR